MNKINYRKATGIIIQNNNDDILFLKRKSNGLWTLAGGKVEDGESSIECAYRELEEETGIKDIVLELYTCTTSFTNNQHWKEKTYIGKYYDSIENIKIEEGIFEKFQFFSLEKLPPLKFIETYDHLIISQLKGISKRSLTHD